MLDLLAGYTITQIVIFIIALVLAIKGAWDIMDFFREKYQNRFNKDYEKKFREEELIKHYEACRDQHKETLEIYDMMEHKLDDISNSVKDLSKRVDRLTISDKNDIKQYIVREYHYFVEEKKQIDDYSLDCILLRYEDYKAEGGNSYIDTLINELKALPKHSPVNK